MDKADLYNKANSLQKKDAVDVLDAFVHLLRWHPQDKLMDVGCGDGDIMINVLLNRLPKDRGSILGVDVSPEMIKFARANYEDDSISFQLMDIGSAAAAANFHGVFDHVFSFDCLHWVQDQTTVMKNIFQMMKPGGDMIVNLIAKNHIYDVYKMMAQDPKWKPYMNEYQQYISPYNESLNPAADMKKNLKSAGFKNIRVEYKHKKYCFRGLKSLCDSVVAVNPFLKNIPPSLHQDYLDHYVSLVKDLGLIEENNNNINDKVIVNTLYTVLMAYATKD